MKKAIKVIILLSLIVSTLTACGEKKLDTSKIQVNREINDIAKTEKLEAPKLDLLDLKGNKYTIEQFKGKTVVINFFTTWCAPCIEELPSFVEVGNMYEDKGVEVLFVNMGEKKEEISTYIKESPISGKNILLDIDLEASKRYEVNQVPTTYIIDKDGNVFARFTKSLTKGELIDAIEAIN